MEGETKTGEAVRVLLVVSEDWFFLSHRLPFALWLREQGYEVSVACADSGRCGEISAHGLTVFPLKIERKSIRLIGLFREFAELLKVVKTVQPDIVHTVALRMVILTWFCRLSGSGFHTINAITGMGTLFSGESLSIPLRGVRFGICQALPLMLKGRRVDTVFQNSEDRQMALERNWCNPGHCHLIRGVGIGIPEGEELGEKKESDQVRFLFAGRLLADKGIFELLKASETLMERGIDHELWIVGDLDEANPNSITQAELDEWRTRSWMTFTGWVRDVQSEMRKADVVVLPSYREGLPKVLLEAGSLGLPVITCDVVGCREVIIDRENGLLAKVQDADSLAEAMEVLIVDSDERRRLGQANLERMKKHFSETVIFGQFLSLYHQIEPSESEAR